MLKWKRSTSHNVYCICLNSYTIYNTIFHYILKKVFKMSFGTKWACSRKRRWIMKGINYIKQVGRDVFINHAPLVRMTKRYENLWKKDTSSGYFANRLSRLSPYSWKKGMIYHIEGRSGIPSNYPAPNGWINFGFLTGLIYWMCKKCAHWIRVFYYSDKNVGQCVNEI